MKSWMDLLKEQAISPSEILANKMFLHVLRAWRLDQDDAKFVKSCVNINILNGGKYSAGEMMA